MKQKVRIILPTYNERNNINILIPKIFKIFKENKINGDILIVDDNSPDGTANLAKKLSKKYPIKILEREKKLGIGSAYVLGFKKSLEDKKDIIFEMDSDLSHDPKYIPEFIEKINSGFDVVIGERKKVVGWNWYRKLISWGGNFIGRNIAGVKIKDLTTGYRAYKRHVLDSINLDKINSSGYCFQLEMIARSLKKNFKIGSVLIVFYNRRRGKSKLSKLDMLEFLFLAIKIRLRLF